MNSSLPWLGYVITCLLIELTPGPNMGFLAVVAATRGRRYGWSTVAGITIGLMTVGLLAALGVAALIESSPVLYQGLRYGGGAYLLFLAWEQWKESRILNIEEDDKSNEAIKYFRHGLIVNLLNPKAAVFYIAVLPTYLIIEAGAPSPQMQAVKLTLIYVGIATAIHILIVGFAGGLRKSLISPRWKFWISRIFAGLLAAIAVWMIVKTAR